MTAKNAYFKKLWFWVGLGLVFLLFLFLIRSILLPFVLGMMIAYFLDPAADWLEKKKFSREGATGLLIVGFFSLLVVALLALSPMLLNQFQGLMQSLPEYMGELRKYLDPIVSDVWKKYGSGNTVEDAKAAATNLSGPLLGVAKNVVAGLFTSGMAFFNTIAMLVLTPVVAFYLLRDYDHMVMHVDRLLPRDHAQTIREQVRLMDDTISGYLRGQVNVCLILSVFYAVALSASGLKYGFLIGIVTGLISFIPYVGALSSFAVTMLVAVFQFDEIWRVLLVMGIFGIGQFLEGNVLVPKLVGSKVGLHPAWVIFGMLAGGALFGFVGILLAVPLSAIIGVLVRFAVAQYKRSSMYQGDEYEVSFKAHKRRITLPPPQGPKA